MDAAGLSISANTVRRALHESLSNLSTESQPSSSPRSSPIPSTPGSPTDSVSSFPSVSSSFFFSSAAASPPRRHSHLDRHDARDHSADEDDDDVDQGLIIPSLILPSALRRPTPHGQTLGSLRLLVLGARGSGKTALCEFLIEDNDDIVEVDHWEQLHLGGRPSDNMNASSATNTARILRASTDWFEHHDGHGLEKHEPMRNVEIWEVPAFPVAAVEENGNSEHDSSATGPVAPGVADAWIETVLLPLVHEPFELVRPLLAADVRHSSVLTGLLASPDAPFFTAAIFLVSSPPTPVESEILNTLAPLLPVILLSRGSTTPPGVRHPKATFELSSFRPKSRPHLRQGLFRSSETLASLRTEVAERFLRWLEVERAVDSVMQYGFDQITPGIEGQKGMEWTKSRWEAEWDISRDAAKRMKQLERRQGAHGVTLSSPQLPPLLSSPSILPQFPRRPETIRIDTALPLHHNPAAAHTRHSGPHAPPTGTGHNRQTTRKVAPSSSSPPSPTTPCTPLPLPPTFDPLHLPSLVMFSLSALAPLRARVLSWSWTWLGGFCVGVGVGWVLKLGIGWAQIAGALTH